MLFIPLDNTVYFTYPGDITGTALRAAMSQWLCIYPEFGGHLVQEDGQLYIDLATPHVDIYEVRVDELPDVSTLDPSRLAILKNKLVEVQLPVPGPGPASSGELDSTAELMRLTLLRTHRGQGFGVAVSYNHITTDGTGFFASYRALAGLCRGDEPAQLPGVAADKRAALITWDVSGEVSQDRARDRGVAVAGIHGVSPQCEWRLLDIPQASIEATKAAVSSSPVMEGRVVSTNDVLCAALWKLRAEFAEDDHAELQFSMAYQFRGKRSGAALSSSYFGNATIPLIIPSGQMAAISVGDIRLRTLAEVVSIIRARVDAFQPQDVDEAMTFLNQSMYRSRELGLGAFLRGTICPPFELSGVHTSNWFPYMDLAAFDLGTGPCQGALVASAPAVPLAIILPLPGARGVRIQAAVPAAHAADIDKALAGATDLLDLMAR